MHRRPDDPKKIVGALIEAAENLVEELRRHDFAEERDVRAYAEELEVAAQDARAILGRLTE